MTGYPASTKCARIQRSSLFCAPGSVKFVPAVARLLCLALPGSFLTMFVQYKEDLCTEPEKMACTWFGEIHSCCYLLVLLGTAWSLGGLGPS